MSPPILFIYFGMARPLHVLPYPRLLFCTPPRTSFSSTIFGLYYTLYRQHCSKPCIITSKSIPSFDQYRSLQSKRNRKDGKVLVLVPPSQVPDQGAQAGTASYPQRHRHCLTLCQDVTFIRRPNKLQQAYQSLRKRDVPQTIDVWPIAATVHPGYSC